MTLSPPAMPHGAPVLCLLGPTASGKTALALELAKHFPLEIVSVDSALVYQGMDIGTAKPTPTERECVRHHLIDLLAPSEIYSAARFVTDARQAIEAVHARGRIPLLVGGTMLYARALFQGLNVLPAADVVLRETLQARVENEGLAALYAQLAAVDPQTAARLAPGDSQRIQRALEVWLLTGTPISALHAAAQTVPAFAFRTLKLGLMPAERGVLHARIADRFKSMLSAGFVDEVVGLRALPGVHAELPSMRAVGYRQCWQFLDGALTASTFQESAIAATRQLAKRQMTWLRSMADVTQIDCLRTDLDRWVVDRVASFLLTPSRVV